MQTKNKQKTNKPQTPQTPEQTKIATHLLYCKGSQTPEQIAQSSCEVSAPRDTQTQPDTVLNNVL